MNPVVQSNPKQTANDYFNQGNQFKQSDQYQEAVEAYQKAIELNPNFSWYYHNLAEVWVELEEWQKAMSCFRQACEINPNSEWSFYQLGEALVQQGELEEAIAAFQKSIEINPGYSEFHSSLGEVLWQFEQLEKAENYLQKAVELDHDSVKAYQILWEVLAKQGKGDEGLVYLRKAVELNPVSWELQQKLGEVLQGKGEFTAAEKCYRVVIQLNSDYHWAYYKLGVVLREQGRLEEAIAYLREAVELEPSSAICHHYLGHSLFFLQEWEEAIECYRQAIELARESAIIYQHLGDALSRLGQWNEALNAYHYAVELDTNLEDDEKTKKTLSYLKKQCELTLDGYLDEVDGYLIRGWAWDSSQPSRALTLVVCANDSEVMRIIANAPRADLKQAGIGTGNYGFAVRLPKSVCEAAPFNLTIKFENCSKILRTGQLRWEYDNHLTANFQGNCEPIFQDKIRGWAVDKADLMKKINVSIYEGENFMGKAKADIYRKDLQDYIGGDGKCGFAFDIPLHILDNQRHELTLLFDNSLIELENSPIILEAESTLNILCDRTQKNLNKIFKIINDSSDG